MNISRHPKKGPSSPHRHWASTSRGAGPPRPRHGPFPSRGNGRVGSGCPRRWGRRGEHHGTSPGPPGVPAVAKGGRRFRVCWYPVINDNMILVTSILTMVYKPTNILWGHHLVWIWMMIWYWRIVLESGWWLLLNQPHHIPYNNISMAITQEPRLEVPSIFVKGLFFRAT